MEETEQVGTSTAMGMYHLFLGNTTYTLLLAVTAIIVGRVLGPDGYGLYTVAIIISPFLFNAIRLGLDTAATRYAARLRSEGRNKDATLFVLGMVIIEVGTAAVLTLVFLSLSGMLASSVLNRPKIGGFVLPMAMLSIVGQAAYTVTSSGLVGLGRYDRAALFQALLGATRLVVSAGLVLLGFGVVGAVAGYTVAFFLSGALGIVLVVGMSGATIPHGLKDDLTTGLRYGWPVYLSILASGFVVPAINTFLALTVSNSQIGGYAAAGTFGGLVGLFTYPISTALFPLFSKKVDDHASLGETYQRSVWFTGLLVLPVASFTIAFSRPLMATFYGVAYAFGAGYLALFAAINLFAGLGILSWSALLNGIGHTRDVLSTTALGSAVSVAAAVLLIQPIGVAGAIIGQILGTGVTLAVGTWMVRQRLGVGLGLGSAWKLFLSAALAAAICYPLSWLFRLPEASLALGVVAYIAVFIPILALLKTMDEETISSLRGYFGFSKFVLRLLDVAIKYYDLVARARKKN